ncbi:MAG: FAD-dependent oxidoreductase [Rhodospirillaceae bacterium]|nr:FAD-dependent oxidoreductase [Rhodospirillaceae bacterium]
MSRDPRYDILFEPLKIGPVTAKNRFYQVPHCTGLGWLRPRMLADLRATKAEGGWGVVCTEYCSIHPASDDLPYPSASLWDAGDIRAHALMTEKVHAHGALAGVELWIGGARTANLHTREVPLGVASMPNLAGDPYQTRAMDREDIRDVRRWHRNAALRAREAGFDIVYVYATHGYLLSQFLSAETNTRSDEYGGSLENRVRLVRELIEDTRDAVGDRCAVALRFSAEAGGGGDGNPVTGEHRDMIGLLAEAPDLWDINIGDYSLEMGVSRFVREGSLEPYMAYVKSLTSKPVVTVGRFTSPDTMVSQLRRGIVDFIGAARPSIADPFLPRKIEEGRLEDIRECIGCNVCYSGDGKSVPIRCTQNPTMSEEWRRGWHPEKIARRKSESKVLVIGAGPAGLEAARALGQRGYDVMLAEAGRELGGRVTREAALPGLSEWARVRDYRTGQIAKMPNIEIFRESRLGVRDVLDVAADHVVVATGATWRRDGVGRFNATPLAITAPATALFTPDDIMAGKLPAGRVILFDDDSYYMGSVIAERLVQAGCEVVFVTPDDSVASWGGYTAEQVRTQRRLMEAGVEIVAAHGLTAFDGKAATLSCAYTGRPRSVAAQALVLVTLRQPEDALYQELKGVVAAGDAKGAPRTLRRIGDCDAPAIIAAAVFAGHRYARELEETVDRDNPLKYDRVFFADGSEAGDRTDAGGSPEGDICHAD